MPLIRTFPRAALHTGTPLCVVVALSTGSHLESVGITCALCHSTVDNSCRTERRNQSGEAALLVCCIRLQTRRISLLVDS